ADAEAEAPEAADGEAETEAADPAAVDSEAESEAAEPAAVEAEAEAAARVAAQESDQALMMDATGLVRLYRGAVVEGPVVKVTNDEVYLDIAWKSEGVLPLTEMNEPPQLGDIIKAQVTKLENQEGYPELSRRRLREVEAKDTLLKQFESKEEVSAKVTEAVKGGLLVDLGMRGFVPASHIQLGYADNLSKYVGQTLRLRIIEFDERKKRLVLSQKVILSEEAEVVRKKALDNLMEGMVLKGKVRRLASFGAFVNIGDVDGLLHISDMSFSRISHPSEVVKIGEEIDVKILRLDKGSGRISLGLKQLKGSPWLQVREKYPLSSTVTGKVVRLTSFGAFIQLEDGVDALVHISQLAHRHVTKVDEVLKTGDIITAKVIECRPDDKRISLSIKELLPKGSGVLPPASEAETAAWLNEAGGEAEAETETAAAETEDTVEEASETEDAAAEEASETEDAAAEDVSETEDAAEDALTP
ncbi:MAG: 30S ribosomal protein S1, partial [Gracilibacteraceae bacterium]|nr:30S ribosomal protein S1 [Gracilibacteraceae bacterium]